MVLARKFPGSSDAGELVGSRSLSTSFRSQSKNFAGGQQYSHSTSLRTEDDWAP